jgi:hypothetical protein
MLNKLLKHEIKATARLFLPLYLALLIFALVNRVINPLMQAKPSNNINMHTLLGIFSITIYVALIIGIFVMTLVIMIQRFYKNLLGDEGYLMFTLPVKTWMHVVSKLLIAMFWVVLSFLATICSILILINVKNFKGQLLEMINAFIDFFGYSPFFIIPIYILIWIASNIIMIYAAISLGHLFENHKLLASFGMYCALYIAYQIISALYVLLLKNTFFNSIFSSSTPPIQDIKTFVISLGFLSIIFAIANFILTNTILKKKLNLE